MFEDKILIENRSFIKYFLSRRLPKQFPYKADILDISCKKSCSLFSHTDSFFRCVMKYCDN